MGTNGVAPQSATIETVPLVPFLLCCACLPRILGAGPGRQLENIGRRELD